MNQNQLLEMLNTTPITINVKYVEDNISLYEREMNQCAEVIKKEMKNNRFKSDKDYLSETNIIRYVEENITNWNANLEKAWNKEEPFEKRINYKFFERYLTSPSDFYGDHVTFYYFYYHKAKQEKKRFETISQLSKDGKIQPTFKINSAGILTTSQPQLNFKPFELEKIFNCKSYQMKLKDDEVKAGVQILDKVADKVANKKEGSVILTVINTTVYFLTGKEAEEEKAMREQIKKLAEETSFIPLDSWVGMEGVKMEVYEAPEIKEYQPKIKEHKMEDLANKFLNLSPNALKAQTEIKKQCELADQRATELNSIFTNMKNKSKEKEMTANATI